MVPLECGDLRPVQLFEDIFDVSRSFARNLGGHEHCEATPASLETPLCDAHHWFVGFSCVSVSGLNHDQRSLTHIDDRTGATGVTFAGCMLILQLQRPRLFTCENVTGLAAGGAAFERNSGIQKAGLLCILVVLVSFEVWLPSKSPSLLLHRYSRRPHWRRAEEHFEW